MAPPLTLIPIGGVFTNTLGEFSLFTAETQIPGTETTEETPASGFNEDWINLVRDFGLLGDGSDETAKIQAALDAAGTGSLNKKKVLLPAGYEVRISPQQGLDNDVNGIVWGPLPICLYIDSGTTFRIDGVLRVIPTLDTSYPNNSPVVFENRNAFVGNSTNRDSDITIEGNGTIDLEGLYLPGTLTFTSDQTSTSPDKRHNFIWAGRFYKCDRLTIKDLTVKYGTANKWVVGFSEHVEFRNCKFVNALRYADGSGIFGVRLITLDVCNHVKVVNCMADTCAVNYGVFNWASKNVLIQGNDFSDFFLAAAPAAGFTQGLNGIGVGYLDYGEEFVDVDYDQVNDIYVFTDGFDAKMIITNNHFCRGGYGLEILGGAWQNVPSRGVQIIGNSLCSNTRYGIYYDGLEGYIISGNDIRNNGWGTPVQFD